MNDADRQLLTEVRDLLRQVVNPQPSEQISTDIVMLCAAPDIKAAIRARNQRIKSHRGKS